VNPLLLFGMMVKASLLSFSGMGNVPSLHADLLARGWATNRQFVESLAVGQVSPGPTGLWVVSLGYLVDGLRGALLACAAIVIPPLLVVAIERGFQRVRHLSAVKGFVHGLGLGVVGTFVVVLLQLLHQNRGSSDPRALGFVLAGLLLASLRRVPVALIIGGAAVAGIVMR
jgi:chromate transporter